MKPIRCIVPPLLLCRSEKDCSFHLISKNFSGLNKIFIYFSIIKRKLISTLSLMQIWCWIIRVCWAPFVIKTWPILVKLVVGGILISHVVVVPFGSICICVTRRIPINSKFCLFLLLHWNNNISSIFVELSQVN